MTNAVSTRAWLNRIAISLLVAVLIGGLSYLLARALFTAYLLYQQPQFVEGATGVLRSGDLIALGETNLREQRKLVRALDMQYAFLSAQIGFIAAATSAVASYIWLERRSAREQGRRYEVHALGQNVKREAEGGRREAGGGRTRGRGSVRRR